MNKIRKFFSLMLSMTLCLSSSHGFVTAQEISKSKLSLDLQRSLEGISDEEKVPVCIWIEDIDYKKVEDNTLLKTGFSDEILLNAAFELYKPLNNSCVKKIEEKHGEIDIDDNITEVAESYLGNIQRSDNHNLEKYKNFYKENINKISELSSNVNTYISKKRAIAKAEYDVQNEKFTEEYLKGKKIDFVSSYAPMIIAELNKEDINKLESINKVNEIYLYSISDDYDLGNMNISIPSIDGDYVRDVVGYDGNGIKIGQIENGRPQTGISELSSTSITRGGTNNNTDHASLVAAIIAGSSGMVPQADLYCTTADNFYQNAEWLISSGVTVINCSNGNADNGQYNDEARWIDHVVNQHDVSWVQASGNNGPNGYVLKRGLSYNAITVGAIDDNGTVSTSDDTYADFTSYNTYNACLGMKPDVVAPGCGFSLSNGCSGTGTSLAAPHVTGMVAQIMQYMPYFSLRPDAIKAAVLSSCDRKVTNEFLGWITNKEGAGVINALNAIDAIVNCYSLPVTTSNVTYTYSPQTSGFKKFVISWIKQNTNTGTNHGTVNTDPSVTNFNLAVYDSSGNLIANSVSSYNNAELVGFTANSSQTYTIEIERVNSFSTNEKITYTYWD